MKVLSGICLSIVCLLCQNGVDFCVKYCGPYGNESVSENANKIPELRVLLKKNPGSDHADINTLMVKRGDEELFVKVLEKKQQDSNIVQKDFLVCANDKEGMKMTEGVTILKIQADNEEVMASIHCMSYVVDYGNTALKELKVDKVEVNNGDGTLSRVFMPSSDCVGKRLNRMYFNDIVINY